MTLLPAAAHAIVINVVTSPDRTTVGARGAATINIRWLVTRTAPVGAGAVNVTSANALLQIGGSTVATLGDGLTQVSNLPALTTGTLTYNETLTVSAALARQIADAPAGSVRVVRTFTDTFGPATGFFSLYAGVDSSAALTVRRISLSFENDARADVVRRGDTIRAVADISFRNNGTLRGEWRLVDPAAALGGGTGRVLQTVRQTLSASGEGRTRIVSPPLPTKTNGLHLVSFSVQDTTAGFEIPILQYFVLEGTGDRTDVNIAPLAPGEGAVIGRNTVFSWEAFPGADAYQIMVFLPGGEQPVTGKLVPGSDTTLSLSALTLEDLAPGIGYEWQIRAFSGGQVIGNSPRRTMTAP